MVMGFMREWLMSNGLVQNIPHMALRLDGNHIHGDDDTLAEDHIGRFHIEQGQIHVWIIPDACGDTLKAQSTKPVRQAGVIQVAIPLKKGL